MKHKRVTENNISKRDNNPINWVYSQKALTANNVILSQAHGNGYRFVGFDSWNDTILELIKSGSYIYEDYLICKPYIDYEYKCDYTDYIINPTRHDRIALKRMKCMKEYINRAMNIITGTKHSIGKNRIFDIKIAKSHGIISARDNPDHKYYKYSYHFV